MAANQGEQPKGVQISPETAELLKAIIHEVRKPTEVEQKKLDEAAAKTARDEREALEIAQAQVAGEESKRKNCPHARFLKGQRSHAWRGQVNSGDQTVAPVCTICSFTFPSFKASLEQIQGGVSLHEAYPSLDVQTLTQLHKQSYPEGCAKGSCFICKKPVAKSA